MLRGSRLGGLCGPGETIAAGAPRSNTYDYVFKAVRAACARHGYGLLAHLIGVRRVMHLVAGYDPRTVADDAGLARMMNRICWR
jgi:hypothetical protein